MTEYKSVEQQLWDRISKDEDVYGFFTNLAKYAYGVVATPFRLPTFVRKLKNRQTLLARGPGNDDEFLGAGVGAGGALFVLGAGIEEAIQNKNYIPLAVLATTNLASGFYELGRLAGKKRNEVLEARVKGVQ